MAAAATAPIPAPVAAPVPIAGPTPVAASIPVVKPAFTVPGFAEVSDRTFFEILETYQNRIRPLNDLVTWDTEEESRLKTRRIEAYQLRNGTDYKPHDVFHLWPYQPVDPDHVIKQVTLKVNAPKILPEFSQILHVNVVSDRVMKAIVELEEGRHAFYPIDIMSPDGGVRCRYHFMQFLEHTDCTVPKLGGFRKGARQDGTTFWVRTSTGDKVFLDIERIGSRHFFYDKRAKSGWFISGELTAKLGDFLPSGLLLAEAGVVRRQA
ncbi:imm11 family protein [Taklimakanibacter lacteus]|uniref:imm11 family protein n=1 Tax=Taklimakanibacter lacteus TaxID=2268456 RepID=UPI0013C5342A